MVIMELRFDVILYSKLGNENSDAAISNFYAGRRFPTSELDLHLSLQISSLIQCNSQICSLIHTTWTGTSIKVSSPLVVIVYVL